MLLLLSITEPLSCPIVAGDRSIRLSRPAHPAPADPGSDNARRGALCCANLAPVLPLTWGTATAIGKNRVKEVQVVLPVDILDVMGARAAVVTDRGIGMRSTNPLH